MNLSDQPVAVVAALIFHDQRLLVCQRRADGAFPLKWEFPGGKVEKGESDVDALRRELSEELGVEARGFKLFCQYEHCYPNGPTVSLRFFVVHGVDAEPRNLVFERIEWSRVSEMDRYDFLDGDRPIIDRLKADFAVSIKG